MAIKLNNFHKKRKLSDRTFLNARRTVLLVMLILTLIGATAFAIKNYRDGVYDAVIMQGVLASFSTMLIIGVLRKRHTTRWAVAFLAFFFSILATVQFDGGNSYSPIVFVWLYLVPIVGFFLLGRTLGFIFIAATLIPGVYGAITIALPLLPMDDQTRGAGNLIFTLLAVTLISFQYENHRTLNEKRLAALAAKDALTGLYNRQILMERFDDEMQRAKRFQTALSLVVLDLDNFKNINDTFGHDAGDHVLKYVATILRRYTRASDTVARLGGEEFAILLPATALENAQTAAENLRKALEEDLVQFKSKRIGITGSFGIVQWDTEASSFEDLYAIADRRLYVAKNTGRNRVVSTDQSFDGSPSA